MVADPIVYEPLTPETALAQLGLSASATQEQVQAAREAAIAELDLMARNARSESLSASYRRARAQIDRAYEVLRSNGRAAGDQADAKAAQVQNLADKRETPKRISEDPSEAAKLAREAADKASQTTQAAQEAARLARHAAQQANRAAQHATDTARQAQAAAEVASEARKVLEQLRQQSAGLADEIKSIREDLRRIGDSAKALGRTVADLGEETEREIGAVKDARRRADQLLTLVERNESEIATAAMHAEAYRDSAMYAAQAAEKLLRALSEPETPVA